MGALSSKPLSGPAAALALLCLAAACTGSGGGEGSSAAAATAACGGDGQRACCFIDRPFKPCDTGLLEVLGCSGDCGCSITHCEALRPCGGDGQRGCCVNERLEPCDAGLLQEPGCTGGCVCAGGLVSSSGTCRPVAPCGGELQRACCTDERPFHPCDAGLLEVLGCEGNCQCSISHCEAFTPCGGEGQRACCVTDRAPPLCDAGLFQVPGCPGSCACAGGLFRSGHTCQAAPPCGGLGQRACCESERPGQPCDSGLRNTLGCQGDCACSISHCEALTPCGGAGQRACCVTDLAPPCQPGLVALPECAGDCACGGLGEGFRSGGTCAAVTSCGGKGQRACCVGERLGLSCDAGLSPFPGCSGDCTCAGLGGNSTATCSVIEAIAEPESGQVASETPLCSMRGYADIHLHLFTHLAHGGAVLAGEPWSPLGVNEALRPDFGTFADLVDVRGNPAPPASCPLVLPACGTRAWHEAHDFLGDTAGWGSMDRAASGFGAPLFNGWPRWSSTTHQQAYLTWLERAWRGGLRLTVMLAGHSEALCMTAFHRRDLRCDDPMGAVDLQLAAARALEADVDARSGGAGLGWFRIVTSPAQARQAIGQGKLAVVLGVEVDNLFGCKNAGDCDAARVTAGVDRLHAQGVRHLFPIHDFDNAFGGTATWQDGINVGNALSQRTWWQPENCVQEGYGFWLDSVAEGVTAAAAAALKGVTFPGLPPAYPSGLFSPQASCNASGLSPLGSHLVSQLMQRRMVIDVDHLSRRSLADVLALAEPRGYPLVAGHVLSFDLHQQRFAANSGRHERMRTAAQLEAIRAGGGLVGAMLKDEVQDTEQRGSKVTLPYGTVADDCRHSSRSFAQAFQYAVDRMGGRVAFGSDFNGIGGHVGPRFGSDACGGNLAERGAQLRAGNALPYPFTLAGFGTFDRLVTGQKAFDFNVDGLANVGLLPDLVADLGRIGLRPADMDAIFRSAEAYVELWERIEGTAGGSTRVLCEDRTVAAGPACSADASIASDALRADPGTTLTQTPPGPYPLGTTQVQLTAVPAAGCGPPLSCSAAVTVTDRQPPTLSQVLAHPSRLWPPNHKLRPVTVAVTAADLCDPAPPACHIVGVSSNGPPHHRGQASWVITGPLTVDLRAEKLRGDEEGHGEHCDDRDRDRDHHRDHDHDRDHGRDGNHDRDRPCRKRDRIYTIEVECRDGAGNASRGSATVVVAPDKR